MEKLTDQELDSIFKAAAEGIKPEYDVAAWEGMNERLNASAKSPSAINRWLPLSILGLIIFSGGVWIGYTLSNPASEPDTKKDGKQILTESKVVSIDIDNQDLSQKTTPQYGKVAKDGNQVSDSDNRNSQSGQPKQITLVDTKGNTDDRIIEKYVSPDRLSENYKIEINDSHENEIVNASNLQQSNKDANKLLLAEEPGKDSASVAKIEARQEADTTKSGSKQDNKKEKAVVTKGIFIRGLASPDFSSIDFGSSGTVGSNYALLIEYQLNTRWSVSTGAIRSLKKYS